MSEKCPIIAIDPGNRQSAYCVIDCNRTLTTPARNWGI